MKPVSASVAFGLVLRIWRKRFSPILLLLWLPAVLTGCENTDMQLATLKSMVTAWYNHLRDYVAELIRSLARQAEMKKGAV